MEATAAFFDVDHGRDHCGVDGCVHCVAEHCWLCFVVLFVGGDVCYVVAVVVFEEKKRKKKSDGRYLGESLSS